MKSQRSVAVAEEPEVVWSLDLTPEMRSGDARAYSFLNLVRDMRKPFHEVIDQSGTLRVTIERITP